MDIKAILSQLQALTTQVQQAVQAQATSVQAPTTSGTPVQAPAVVPPQAVPQIPVPLQVQAAPMQSQGAIVARNPGQPLPGQNMTPTPSTADLLAQRRRKVVTGGGLV
jgi:hypothetical protein